ncbi:MAG: hypothetical protein HFG54_14635 [Lachnospiraceae bacterium]|nr:hypothetical protein [Lachnospiraceae bacterium]
MEKSYRYRRRGIQLNWRSFLGTLPFAFLLFRFYIGGISKILQLSMVLIFIGLYFFQNISRVRNRLTIFIKGFLIFFLFFIISILYPAFLGTGDFTYARLLAPYFIDLGSWSVFVLHCDKQRNENKTILNILAEEFCKIVTLYIMFTVLCMIISPLREFVISHSNLDDAILMDLRYEKYLARVSWDGFAGFKATFMCSLGVFLSLVSISSTKNRLLQRRSYIYLGIMLLGNTFYGRTGLVTSGGLIVIYICREIVAKRKLKTLLRIGFIFIALIGIYTVIAQFNDSLQFIYNWAFEPIINYLKGNGLTTTSSSNWLTMWNREFEMGTLLHGDGRYTLPDGHYYMRIDIGIYRMIYMWGIPMMLLYYFYCLNEYKKTVLYKINHFTFVYVFFIFMLFEIKGEIVRNLYAIFIAFTLLRDDGFMLSGRRYEKS